MIQQAIEFLREHPEGVLATVSNNRPQTRVFQVMKIEDSTLYFATAPQKAVWRQLQANPAVEFLVLHDCVSVRCSGTALFDVDDDAGHVDILKDVSFTIAHLEYFDLRPTPPVSLHIDLTTGITADGFRGERFTD